jgi:hypothetical protein
MPTVTLTHDKSGKIRIEDAPEVFICSRVSLEDLIERHNKLTDERDQLQMWKESSLRTTPNWQEIGREMEGLPCGGSIPDNILPYIRRIKQERDEWKTKFKDLDLALKCELRDPYGTIWECAARLQKDLDHQREVARELHLALERLLAFSQHGFSLVEKAAAEEQARQALAQPH